ncbi:recombinase family protein [Geomonas diazotrophica]|uniref:recombinase family protein n=1 Tax=Geomonas diazotrophica TaxID=2843197 RepID=UPI0038B292E1
MLTILAAIATFEREMIVERQQEEIARAKAAGKYKGRVATARAKTSEVLTPFGRRPDKKDLADALGISIASVHRIVRNGKADTKVYLGCSVRFYLTCSRSLCRPLARAPSSSLSGLLVSTPLRFSL